MPTFAVTPEIIAAIAGIVLSLLFSYVPGLNTSFAGWTPTTKRLIMLGLLAAIAVGIYGLGCGGILQAGLTCDRQGLIQVIWMFILAAIANQSAYQLSPQTSAVIEVKALPAKTDATRPS